MKVKLKKKFKYPSRSKHAQNRSRGRDGKFAPKTLSKKDSQTAVSYEEGSAEEDEEREPCKAEEPNPQIPSHGLRRDTRMREESVQAQEASERLENMDEVFKNFPEFQRSFSRNTDLQEEQLPLNRNDSLFRGK